MKTRLLFILNSLCVGGAEKQVVSLINHLDAARHAVSLLYLKDERALLGQIDRSRCSEGVTGLKVARGLEWAAVREIARRIDAQQTEVLVCTNMYALLYGWLARRMSRRGHVVRLVEVFHTTLPGSRKEAWQMHLYRRLVRDVDLLVYVCQAQADHWRAWGLAPRRETVIHNGIDVSHFTDTWTAAQKSALRQRLGFGPDDLVVGLCAVMRPEKAHGDLLEALAARARCGDGARAAAATQRQGGVAPVGRQAAVRTGAAWGALLIGDGPERPAIERRIEALGLAGRVRITGFLQDVRPLVAACDAMVIPSHAVETFSIAALESMALGKPMVMTDIGGAREQVRPGEHGWLVPPGDIPALSAALDRLREAPARAALGSQAAHHVRRHFGIQSMTRAYEGAFQALRVDSGVVAGRLATRS